jgi:hypothetical protein
MTARPLVQGFFDEANGGRFPPPDRDGNVYLKVPVNRI